MSVEVNTIFPAIVQIDSETGNEKEMALYVAAFLKDVCHLNPTIDQYNNVFAQTKGTGEAFLFNGHLDTVPPGKGIKPIDDGTYWRSSGDTVLGSDDKSCVAAILSAVSDVTSRPNENWRPLDILFTTSEEKGNYGAAGFDRSRLRSKTGFIFDAGMPIGTVITKSPYYSHFVIDIQGKASHAAHRDEAIPGLPIAVNVIQKLEKLRTRKALINIGIVSGGSAPNTVIGEMMMTGETRSYDEKLFKKMIQEIEQICAAIPHVALSELVVENPGYTHTADRLDEVGAMLRRAGVEPVMVPTYGCSDGNLWNEDFSKLAVFTLGEGTEDAHTPQEKIRKSDLDLMVRLILDFARN